jgi:hypothetical protein
MEDENITASVKTTGVLPFTYLTVSHMSAIFLRAVMGNLTQEQGAPL